MEQAIRDQITSHWNEYEKKEYQAEYQYFKDNYSIEALSTLDANDQAKRLFASKGFSDENNVCRGYFCWAEHGRKINGESVKSFGTAKGWTGGQDGPIIDKDGSAHYSDIGIKRTDRTRVDIDFNQLKEFATVTFTALKKICELTQAATLNTKSDYENLYQQIKTYLASLNEKRLYWKEDGEPSGQLIKYLHCSFPEKFACWYSRGTLQSLLEKVDPNISLEDDAFILNSELVKVSKDLGIDDNANFGVFIGKLFDIGRNNKKSGLLVDKRSDYYPSLEEYDPGIDSEFYYQLFKNGEIEKDKLDAIYYIYKLGGETSCKQIAKSFGGEPGHYSNRAARIAGLVHDKTKCKLYIEDGKESYWPILFFGRKADSNEAGKFIWKMRDPLYDAIDKLQEECFFEEVEMIAENNIEKNTILFGPPGTGKTYSTVTYAVAIVEKESLKKIEEEARDDYSAVYERYKKYIEEGYIEFTTFHQSYGYEDFIEGIKPVVDSEDESSVDVKYDVKPGVFKAFCEKISHTGSVSFESLGINESPTIWKVSLMGTGENPVRKDCMENGRIRIGYQNIEADSEDSQVEGKKTINAFYSKMRIGDIVLSCYSSSTIDAIGVVTGDAEWNSSITDSYKGVRKVNWIVKGINEDILKYNNNKTLTMPTIYRLKSVTLGNVMDIVLKYNPELQQTNDASKNYVFIIDEINRGNISKIFGELITLIEENKRLGGSEEKLVKLPYSQDLFGVPSNVYILGTMNTADRSIATIDTALRRRFGFVEMMPKEEFLDGVEVEGINIRIMFQKMNAKIAVLYDREHTIGHAYFAPLVDEYNATGNASLTTLGRIFKNKIMPLLQEYFYDDYEKIGLVLGDNKAENEADKFIKVNRVGYSELFGTSNLGSDEAISYEINANAFFNIDSYRHIEK